MTVSKSPTGAMLEVVNPADGKVFTQIPADTAASVADKFAQATAGHTKWSQVPLADRMACIQRFRGFVEAQLNDLAAIMTSETGKPIRLSRNELNGFLGRLDFFIEQAQPATATETVFVDAGMTEAIEHVPLGVIGNISAWNYPWFVGGNVFVPALLTGNAVLYKPSEFAALTGQAMARLLYASGIPQDAFITLIGGGEVGAALLAQNLDGLFFTGSYATGAKIANTLGPRMVKLQLELGGKDPTYVCEDADPIAAAQSLADGAMYNTGQSCCSVERVYVHEAIYEAFVAEFVATVKSFKMGDPLNEESYIGPITREPQMAVLEGQVKDALAKGATLMTGGKRVGQAGNWFEPTVFANASHDMLLMREETFGPLIGIQKVSNDAQAVALMNDTDYGLTAGVFTPNEARAKTLLSQIKAGTVYWNCCDRVSPRLPWSGYGHSGVGLTLSTYGIQTFTRPKAWHLRKA
jgi:acyl-CoA reductase-like NAD-dependent aldehyde dehydrogenase